MRPGGPDSPRNEVILGTAELRQDVLTNIAEVQTAFAVVLDGYSLRTAEDPPPPSDTFESSLPAALALVRSGLAVGAERVKRFFTDGHVRLPQSKEPYQIAVREPRMLALLINNTFKFIHTTASIPQLSMRECDQLFFRYQEAQAEVERLIELLDSPNKPTHTQS